MKDKMLKLAGVKSEKEFYKKYPTEEAFMKVHGKAFQKAAMGKKMVNEQLTQLTDYSNPPKAQSGLPVYTPTKPQFMQTVKYGQPTLQYKAQGLPDSRMENVISPTAYDITGTDRYYQKELPKYQMPNSQEAVSSVDSGSGKGQAGNAAMKNITSMSKAYGIYQNIKQAVDEKKKAKQLLKVSELTKEAAATRPERQKPEYVRPEDNLFSPDQSSFQTFGSGYDVLGMAENGMQIGGNLTEIQNMYNPGTLYDGLGYEPLDESSRVKQFKKGGDVSKAPAGAIMQALPTIMEKGDQAISLLGDIPAAIISQKTKKWTDQATQNFAQGAAAQATQSQFSPFMEQGGYISHNWQPQVITKFGDYTMDQLLKPDPTMDTLRTGGNIRNNYMGEDEKQRMSMAMGGELQTHWGGDAEVMSYNPYSAGSGETIMLKGNSHEEYDGEGNTGIGMSYSGNMVEAERGEPVAEMEEGGSMEDSSAVVFGNMKIPSYGVSEIGDKNAKGKKFKTYAAHLAKQEAKQNKITDKAIKLVNDVDSDSPFDMLKMNSGMAMLTGADMALKNLATKKRTLAGVQNAILQTAEEQGLDNDSLARGIIKKAKKSDIAQSGEKVSPKLQPLPELETMFPQRPTSIADLFLTRGIDADAADFYAENPQPEIVVPRTATGIGPTDPTLIRENLGKLPTAKELKKYRPSKGEGLFDKGKDYLTEHKDSLKNMYNELLPYIRPVNQMQLQPEQLMGEAFALSQNVLEPVRAQQYKPMLETRAPKMSAQEMLNKNQMDFNAMARQIGNNPAALSVLAAQKQAADRQAIAQVEAANIQQEIAANNRNIAMLNDASLKNLAILDSQYQRQAQAKSATKAQAQTALNSIASKIGQNKLENLQNAVMQNMYNYRFGPKGRIYNVNPKAEFNMANVIQNLDEETYNAVMKQAPDVAKFLELPTKKEKKKEKEKSRNGSIVKAIKGL
jgi:hypothetical protein